MADLTNPRKLSTLLDFSGAFTVGEGRYQVEVLAVDDQRRTCRKEWEINVVRHRAAVVASPTILRANTVAPADFVPWDGRLTAAGDGVRVMVLLDVVNPRRGHAACLGPAVTVGLVVLTASGGALQIGAPGRVQSGRRALT
jgi:hypothetical protein